MSSEIKKVHGRAARLLVHTEGNRKALHRMLGPEVQSSLPVALLVLLAELDRVERVAELKRCLIA